ncbi:MAG: hypothetical protein KBC84_03270 [Proteobacteria bacterium]|nr:hypothetical protein [Pseudomonadota bacterium]
MKWKLCLLLLSCCVGCNLFSSQSDVPQISDSTYSIGDKVFGKNPDAVAIKSIPPEEILELRDKGSYLVKYVAACGNCHGENSVDPESKLTGGKLIRDRFGLVSAANITPDKKTGIGTWNLSDVVSAIRSSIGKDGKLLSLDAHHNYRWMADRDIKAIAIYLLSLKPEVSAIERRELSGFQSKKWGLFTQHHEQEGYIPQPSKNNVGAYGRYLATYVANCYGCHTKGGGVDEDEKPFAGAEGSKSLVQTIFGVTDKFTETKNKNEIRKLLSPEGSKKILGEEQPKAVDVGNTIYGENESFNTAILEGDYPLPGPNIRGKAEEGLLAWTKDDLTNYLNTGITVKGERRDARVCPWSHFNGMTSNDKEAISTFLKEQ